MPEWWTWFWSWRALNLLEHQPCSSKGVSKMCQSEFAGKSPISHRPNASFFLGQEYPIVTPQTDGTGKTYWNSGELLSYLFGGCYVCSWFSRNKARFVHPAMKGGPLRQVLWSKLGPTTRPGIFCFCLILTQENHVIYPWKMVICPWKMALYHNLPTKMVIEASNGR